MFKVQIRDCESNSLVASLGVFRTEEEADLAGQFWFVENPLESEFCEYQISPA